MEKGPHFCGPPRLLVLLGVAITEIIAASEAIVEYSLRRQLLDSLAEMPLCHFGAGYDPANQLVGQRLRLLADVVQPDSAQLALQRLQIVGRIVSLIAGNADRVPRAAAGEDDYRRPPLLG